MSNNSNDRLAIAFAKNLEELSNTLGSFDAALARALAEQDEAENLDYADN